MQLDLFADRRDVMPRNDVLEALMRRHASDSRQAWQWLADECPADDMLPALAAPISAPGEGLTAGFADHEALAAARPTLIDDVGRAAVRMLRVQAGSQWLAPCWRTLAQRAASLAFCADDSDNHAGGSAMAAYRRSSTGRGHLAPFDQHW